jgi:hypothetical protein
MFTIDFIPTQNDLNKSQTQLPVSVNAGSGPTHGV